MEVLEIKPCPFCGSKAKLRLTEEWTCKNTWTVYDVKCTNPDCYLQDGADWGFKTKEEAINLWNKRN